MLNELSFPKIEEDDMDDIWFQQDGATWHTLNLTIDLLRIVLENRIISRNSDVNWPPRSSDLTPLDYFLWGAIKDKCIFYIILYCVSNICITGIYSLELQNSANSSKF